jgi:hypothetical protein
MDKAKVTQDFLYEYLTQHNVNLNRLNELMGIGNGTLVDCFRHQPDRHGKAKRFSAANIQKLNDALPLLADQMRRGVVTFGSAQTYTSRRGETYDPATVPQLRALQRWFKLGPFFLRVVGWTQSRTSSSLCSPTAKAFGTITADQVARINAEVLAVSGMLGGIEVELPE